MSSPRANRSAAGFTLLELLVALNLLALLTVGLAAALHAGNRAAAAVDRSLDQSSQLALAYRFLRDALADAQPLPLAGAAEPREIRFDGRPDRLSFVAELPPHLSIGGFADLTLALDGPVERSRLIVSWRTLTRAGAAAELGEAHSNVLLEHLRAVEFAYFGQADTNARAAWHDYWQAAIALPRLVRIRGQFVDGRSAPELIVTPRLAEGAVR
jgi:general secretion pathway protein J